MTRPAAHDGPSTPGVDPGVDGLPLTLLLEGREVLVVGAGPVSARRARVFLDAGAVLRVVAPEVSPEMAAVLADATEAVVERRRFRLADLDGAWLVHVATGDRVSDTVVSELCDLRRIWCVAAGDAARGTARVPARAGVTTPSGRVRIAVESADPRRSVTVGRDLARALATSRYDLRARRRSGQGWAAVVGGAPDGDLLTVRSRRLLHSADVVVADGPLDPTLRAELDPEVEIVEAVGSDGPVAALVASRCAAGLGVVRVADPATTGAVAEVLRRAGLDVTVVPGVVTLGG